MENNKKESLNRENIEQDIKQTLTIDIWLNALYFVGFSLFLVLYLILYYKTDAGKSVNTMLHICYIAVFGFFSVRSLVLLIYTIYTLFSFRNKYLITTDQLRTVGRKVLLNKSARRLRHFYRTHHYFRFAAHGYFAVGKGRSYTKETYYLWSKNQRMCCDQLLSTSAIDDDFYVVLIDKRIACVYNKKLFELTESTEADNG